MAEIVAPEVIAEGTDWILYDNGLLVIHAGMQDYESAFYYGSNPGVVANPDKVPPWYQYRNQIEEVILEDGVEKVGAYSFQNCQLTRGVTFSNSVTSIGKGAFDASGLIDITIPNSVTTIGDSAFEFCLKLTSVTISDSVTAIGRRAFYESNVSNITLGSGITTIAEQTFFQNDGLTSITIPDGVTTIEGSAFYNCRNLTSVVLPDSITTIANGAFFQCPLRDVYYAGTLKQRKEISGANVSYSYYPYATVHNPNPPLTGATWHYRSTGPGVSSSYYVTFSPNGGTGTMETVAVDTDSRAYILPQSGFTPPTSYRFKAWSVDWVEHSPGDTLYLEEDITVTALWEAVYIVTFQANGGTGTMEPVITTTATYVLPQSGFTPPSGHRFKSWSVNGTEYYPGTRLTLSGDTTVTALWLEVAELTIIVNPNNGIDGLIRETEEIPIPWVIPFSEFPGADMMFTVPNGYYFKAWNVNGTEYGTEDTLTITGGNSTVTFTAIWEGFPVLHVGGALENGKIIGAQFAFARGDYEELSYVQSASMDGDEVQSDELYAELRVTGNPEAWLSGWAGVSRTVPVWFTRYGQIDGHDTVSVIERREKYYFKSLERVALRKFLLTAQSPIGRLTSDFAGGLYDGESLSVVLRAVAGDVPHTVDSRLDSIRVYGWAPYQSRRETLHMLALAYGFAIRRNGDCDLYFTLPDTAFERIPDEMIFHGGAVDYRIGAAYAGAEVSEYTFLRTAHDKEVTLFDNTDGSGVADGLTVVFSDAPVYGLTASGGLTVDWQNVNAAEVSGVGVLTGKAYTVVTGMTYISAGNDADPEQVLSIRDVPLITNLNSETVARKLLSSANAPAVVEMDFLRQNQRPGDLLSFEDPYGAYRMGYLLSMSGSLTSLERVTGTFLTDYTPLWGNTYNAVQVLTGFGEWTVPDSLDGATVRVVLIGGGTGGASGQHGSDATASGGAHGVPGDGGKIHVVRLTVHAGESYGYRCGAGGLGGAPSADYDTDEDDENTYRNNSGTAGGASLFGDYSSASGAVSTVGYSDMIHGTQYAVPGPDIGVDGGAATTGRENNDRNNPIYTDTDFPTLSLPLDDFRNWTYNGQIYDSESWTSGGIGVGGWYPQPGEYAFQEWSYGGLGGGAAVGNNGGDGADVAEYADTGGRGGNGADALPIFPEDTRAYGSGGSGGHGGGEGGAGGRGNTTEESNTGTNGARGAGGSGSRGQDGKAGCILIYYHG